VFDIFIGVLVTMGSLSSEDVLIFESSLLASPEISCTLLTVYGMNRQRPGS
jgi:hypothetical protein